MHDVNEPTITLSPQDLTVLVDRLEAAQTQARAIPAVSLDYPAMNLADGYAVQFGLLQRCLDAGRIQAGWKAGLTSRAKMEQMGVNEPSIGFLLQDMARAPGAAVAMNDLVHPRVECEIAFKMRSSLSGADCSAADVIAATDYIMPAVEIIDSRYHGFRFDLASVVADNGSSARYVCGAQHSPVTALDERALQAQMRINGQVVASGSTSDVMEHPAQAVALLVRVLASLGRELRAGSLVLSGSMTPAMAVQAGDQVLASFEGLGEVAFSFTTTRDANADATTNEA